MRILHLYHDLMNLYGESGNMRVLERHLQDQGVEVVLDRKTLGDALDFTDYDFIYVGSGTERSQKAALEHLRPYADALRAAMESGTVALFTGNAASMFGREVIDGKGVSHPGIGLLDFVSKEHADTRYTGDAIAVHAELDAPLVGFINKCEDWEGELYPLFEMMMGRGNRAHTKDEGFRVENFLGTHLTGPMLVKNPAFLTWLIQLLFRRQPNLSYTSKVYPYEQQAYQVTYQALSERKDNQSEEE